MIDLDGKVCPYCGQMLNDTDDIVVCNACKMPHHRECWAESNGCTTFGCMGTAENIADSDFYKPIYCVNCGFKNENSERFCAECGEELVKKVNIHSVYGGYATSATSNQTTDDEALMVRDNYAGYYKEAFEKIRAGGNKFNWAAFFLAGAWPFYRKMYKLGFTMLGICLGVSMVLSLIGLEALEILTILINVWVGNNANKEYLKKIENMKQKSQNLNQYEKEAYIKRNGGTSVGTGILIPLGVSFVFGIVKAIVAVIIALLTVKTCAYPSCKVKINKDALGEYCYIHTCSSLLCYEACETGERYCSTHIKKNSDYSSYFNTSYCGASGCYKKVTLGSDYCISHTCLKTGCYNMISGTDIYCEEHS